MKSDTAATRGLRSDEPHIAALARLYSRRQEAYCDVMSKVHAFIGKVRKAEQVMRNEIQRALDPFAKKVRRKHAVSMNLQYANAEEETVQLRMRRTLRHEHKRDPDWNYCCRVQGYLQSIRWRREPTEDQSGITLARAISTILDPWWQKP